MRVLPQVALLLLLARAGCSTDDAPGAEDRDPSPSQEERLFENLSGSVRVATSPSTQPFVTEAAANYEVETDVQIETNEMSSRAALARLCATEVAMAAVDRPLGRELRGACRRNQVDPVRVDLGWLAVAVVARPTLDLDCLSTRELRAIWRPGSQVDRYELFGSAPGSTEFELFTRRVVGREGAIRSDWTRIVDPSSMREALAIRERTLAFLKPGGRLSDPRRVARGRAGSRVCYAHGGGDPRRAPSLRCWWSRTSSPAARPTR